MRQYRGQTARGREQRGLLHGGAAEEMSSHGHGMPSGMLCRPMSTAANHARCPTPAGLSDTAKLAPMVMPSGDVVQRDGASHDDAGHEQRQLGVVVALVRVQVVGVHEARRCRRRFPGEWSASAVCDTSLRVLRSMVVQQIHRLTARLPAPRRGYQQTHAPVTWLAASRPQPEGQKLFHGGHDAAGESQKQADGGVCDCS